MRFPRCCCCSRRYPWVYIYGMIRIGITPEVNAVSTLLLLLSIAVVTLSYLIGRRGSS